MASQTGDEGGKARSPASKRTGLWIAAVVIGLGLIAGAALLTSTPPSQEGQGVATFGEIDRPVFPDLSGRRDDVHTIALGGANRGVTLLREEAGVWVVRERDGFPAAPERVADFLDLLASMRAIYATSELPASLAGQVIGPQTLDPGTAVTVNLRNAADEVIVNARIGTTLSTPRGEQLTSVVVENLEESTVLIADGDLQVPAAPSDWIRQTVAHVPVERVDEVEVSLEEHDAAVVIRKAIDDPSEFSAEGVAEEIDLTEGQWIYRWIASALEELRFEDVRAADAVAGFDDAIVSRAVFRTVDGMRVEMLLAQMDDAYLLRLEAAPVEPLPSDDEALSASRIAPPDVLAEIESFNRKVDPWVYEPSELTIDKLLESPRKIAPSS